MPEISVLIAAYKTDESHLKACIDSVLAQTYRNFELLILDDCPEDKNVERVVKSYHDKRISYRKNPTNKGIPETRNELMRWAKGKYFIVMDHDDIMHQKRLEKQYAYMEEHPDVGICGSAYKRFGSLSKIKTVYPEENSDDIKAGLLFKSTLPHPNIIIRADIIRNHNIFYHPEYVSANDRRLYLESMPYANFHNLPDVLMYYRMHKNMTSKQRRQDIVAEQRRLRNTMLESIGVKLSDEEFACLNNYVLKGRCRIHSKKVLNEVEQILAKINDVNQKTGYFPKETFSKKCAVYLIKRCLNAAIYGRVSSRDLLATTKLPVKEVKIPFCLKIFNLFLPKACEAK